MKTLVELFDANIKKVDTKDKSRLFPFIISFALNIDAYDNRKFESEVCRNIGEVKKYLVRWDKEIKDNIYNFHSIYVNVTIELRSRINSTGEIWDHSDTIIALALKQSAY